MTTVASTFPDQYWGSEVWQKFDYYQNPTRVTGGNPLFIWLHGGSWTNNSYASLRDSAVAELWYFVRYLLGAQDPLNVGAMLASMPAEKWDVASLSFGQQKHDTSAIPQCRSLYGTEPIRDLQRGIASLKGLCGVYGFNPGKVIIGGESSGATNAATSQLAPAISGSGQSNTWRDSYYAPNTYDSSARGIIFYKGVCDIRNSNNNNPPTGTDYFHFSRVGAMVGTNLSTATEWNAVPHSIKEALSPRAYFENEDLAGYPGMYAIYLPAGNGVRPLGAPATPGSDIHDSSQLTDMLNAARTARVPMAGRLVTDGMIANSLYPTGIHPRSLDVYQSISNWMRDQVGGASL